MEVDYSRLITVEQIVEQAPAITHGTMRHWLFYRNKNLLATAILKLDQSIFIDIDRFNTWLSLDKDEVSDFRDLRTKQQILENSLLKPGTFDNWLRNRHWNGLEEAVIKKGERRLFIDIFKFNNWIRNNNSNPEFGS
ncbi:hypothetical protein KFE96_04270 [Kordiimonas sp. SCSIO 12603]|uniref:hypothetical protein n=1 Tax=Kordiimonas sp. SCSIO 12603 TaxID=2829596 RepID=UPI0021025E71|nr:hypothetical protein [Kordiimonas sp. SCSIO 12603]UTW59527.1 hypothetical protein KFE96_04270 [Kordiimonas sp. SCSIO 12603]